MDVFSETGQKLSEKERELVTRAYSLFDEFSTGNRAYHDEVKVSRKIALLQDPEQDAGLEEDDAPTPQLHTLRSTLVNCVADQMDNTPTAVIRPERPDTQALAEDLTDIVGRVLYINNSQQLHRQRVEDLFVTGTSVTQVVWDDDMLCGKGDIALIRVPIENMQFDPNASDIQDSRAVFRFYWYPHKWYEEHYPDEAEYVHADKYKEDGAQHITSDEGIMMLEYWYREYDAKTRRYSVHVAYLAGGALLYDSKKHLKRGVYEHGLYPFVVDVYTEVVGKLYGHGMIVEFAPMQRAINRYARYIDENARASAKMRLLVNTAAGLNEDDLADWTKQIIKGTSIGDNAVRWFQTAPLSPNINAQMANFIDLIKQDSGQNQFSRGESGGGITAASAILALQEAGGKTTRLRTEILKYGSEQIFTQILWLIRQKYSDGRVLMVTGKDEEDRAVTINRKEMFGGEIAMPYAVRVQVQKRNPLHVQAENENLLNMFNVLVQGGVQVDPMMMLELLQLDGKDRLLAAMRKAQAPQMAAMTEQAAQMQQAMTVQQDEINKLRSALDASADQLATTQAQQSAVNPTVA